MNYKVKKLKWKDGMAESVFGTFVINDIIKPPALRFAVHPGDDAGIEIKTGHVETLRIHADMLHDRDVRKTLPTDWLELAEPDMELDWILEIDGGGFESWKAQDDKYSIEPSTKHLERVELYTAGSAVVCKSVGEAKSIAQRHWDNAQEGGK